MEQFNILPYNNLKKDTAIWDLYTRKEEYGSPQLDQYGTFPFKHSSHKEVLNPVVSRFLIENGYNIEFPDGQSFALCLTHDVDEIYPPIKHILKSSLICLKELAFDEIKENFFWKFYGKKYSPYLNFKEIMSIEKKFNAFSTFYFLATEKDIHRFRYDIEDLDGVLGEIIDSGWEVGLHGGYFADNNLPEILKEKHRLEKILCSKVMGYRNHYLRFQVPHSWETLVKAGFKYDTTLGYNDTVGFRNGMCHPFLPYNRNTDREINIIEIPLVIMDSCLFNSVKSYDEAWNIVDNLISTVESCNGVLTLNWHTNNFNCNFRKTWIRMYEKILDHCCRKNAWITSGIEIYRWWRKNGY